MADTAKRTTADSAATAVRAKPIRLGRIVLAGLTAAIGVSLAGIMAFAAAHELLAGDFYGVCVAGLVAVFGMQLVRVGYDLVVARRRVAPDSDPLARLWRSERRVYPFLPYARLEIGGR